VLQRSAAAVGTMLALLSDELIPHLVAGA